MKELMKRKLPLMPDEIRKAIDEGEITLTEFEDKNEILLSQEICSQVGFGKFTDGSYLVSMTCPMPGVTPEMMKWWFWWHAKKSQRYRVWYPKEHFAVSYLPKDRAYFAAEKQPEFKNNTHLPIERIGKIVMPLRIDFCKAEEFGFSEKIMEKNDIPLIVCGHVGAMGGLVMHTEMAHIFKRTDEGLMLISRFWLGKRLENPLLRKIILTDETARGMAEHCCVEYRSLAEILPCLYEKYGR
ncbi:MAG: hypothetical protein IJW86_07440 [Clostridia bacterium]|nr:hypothetical protein [Clostridia bacterium]